MKSLTFKSGNDDELVFYLVSMIYTGELLYSVRAQPATIIENIFGDMVLVPNYQARPVDLPLPPQIVEAMSEGVCVFKATDASSSYSMMWMKEQTL